MTNKKIPKKNKFKNLKLNNKNNYKPLLILIIISLIVALLLPYIKAKETFIDTNIALNQLEKNYLT
jgi:hypothetical protein